MKRVIISLLTLVFVAACLLLLPSCKGDSGSTDTETEKGGNSFADTEEIKETDPPMYTVKFQNTDLKDQIVPTGTVLSRPNDPVKSDSIFSGWFTDKSLTNPASFPLTVTGDITLYAGFYSYKDAFEQARNKTIGSSVPGYEYDYTLDVSGAYNSTSLSGHTDGNTKYNPTSEISFYDKQDNSGMLFFDGTKYQFKRGDVLQKVSIDKQGKVTHFSSEQVESSFTYDSSSFAKALFAYSPDQLKEIVPTTVPNEYELKTSLNASQIISIVGNYLNHPVVEKMLTTLPETNVQTGMYVTFNNGYIEKYRYEMRINVSSLSFNLVYHLNFHDPDSVPVIRSVSLPDISIDPTDLHSYEQEIASYLDAYEQIGHSGYEFKVTTAVDFGLTKNAINATFKGSTLRKVDGSDVYFHNDIEIDSDFKNSDLYKSAGISDIHIKRTRIADGSVHIIVKKVLADSIIDVDNYQNNLSDSYYLLEAVRNIGSYTFVSRQQDSVTGEIKYSIGISGSGMASLLKWLNAELTLDPLNKSQSNACVFGTFNENTLSVDSCECFIVVSDNKLSSVAIKAKGVFGTRFEGSSDFEKTDTAAYELNYTITMTNKGDKFEPFKTAKDAK